MPRLVLLELPYESKTKEELEKYIEYAESCIDDCFERGESPFNYHLFHPPEIILRNNESKERKLRIEADLAWMELADAIVVYTDLGITKGMKRGIERAKEIDKIIEHRQLY